MSDTIFALSSGSPPAAIAVIRISGPSAGEALRTLAGHLPKSRRATLVALHNPRDGAMLDRALALWFPGPASATGEAVVEFHLHGGRAVVNAVEGALEALPGLRRAQPGEFTRRAFVNGRIDLAEAEGLADLLVAETELQRRAAQELAGGALSRQVEDWRCRVLALGAAIEATLDFADDDDAAELPATFSRDCQALAAELDTWLSQPRAEALREGYRVVLAGPPNTGKSSLFNALIEDDGAIVSPLAGTTRDVLTRPVVMEGVPFTFVDTAGLREQSDDPIERVGIDRAYDAAMAADLMLWLGNESAGPAGAGKVWEIDARCDDPDRLIKKNPRHRVSALRGYGLGSLRADLIAAAREGLPRPGAVALNRRQHDLLGKCRDAVTAAANEADLLLAAEALRSARWELDRLIGRSGTEDMLDALFRRFCIGK